MNKLPLLLFPLLLAGCGTAPAPEPGQVAPPPAQTAPTLPADAPADATASGEFLLSGQSFVPRGLGAQDVVSDSGKLRVVLSMARTPKGHRYAEARVIWAGEQPLTGEYTVSVVPYGTDAGRADLIQTQKAELLPKYPDFQAVKTSKMRVDASQHPYDTLLCAVISFKFESAAQPFYSPQPYTVCEGGVRTQAQVQADVMAAARRVYYASDWGSDSDKTTFMAAPLRWLDLGGPIVPRNLTTEDVRQRLSLPSGVRIVEDGGLNLNSIYRRPGVAQAIEDGNLKRLQNVMAANYVTVQGFQIYESPTRIRQLLLGRNAGGVSGLSTYLFARDGVQWVDPRTLTGATVKPSLWVKDGRILGTVTVNAPTGTVLSAGLSRRDRQLSCDQNAASDYAGQMVQTAYSEYGSTGTTALQFANEADTGQSVAYDWRVTMQVNGQTRTESGVICRLKAAPPPPPPPPPAPTQPLALDIAEPYARLSNNYAHTGELIGRGWMVGFGIPWTPTDPTFDGLGLAGGSYTVQDTSECGGTGSGAVYAAGPIQPDGDGFWSASHTEPGQRWPEGAGLRYTLTAAQQGQTRTLSGGVCAEDFHQPPPYEGGGW